MDTTNPTEYMMDIIANVAPIATTLILIAAIAALVRGDRRAAAITEAIRDEGSDSTAGEIPSSDDVI